MARAEESQLNEQDDLASSDSAGTAPKQHDDDSGGLRR